MFLPVERAGCSSVLVRIMNMVQTILDYSVKTLVQELDFSELKELIDEDLRMLLERKKIRTDVEALFELSYMERVEADSCFSNDREFEKHIDDDRYRLHLRAAADGERGKPLEVLNRLCNDLYDTVKGGLPEHAESFSTLMLQREYEEVNGEKGTVCPVCVKENIFSAGEGEVDHYFPRRRYPTLALHPYNLLPVCCDCNGVRLKHTKNPLSDSDLGPGELRTVFLPYLRFGKSEIEFSVSEDVSRTIVMKPAPGRDENTEKRIANMERLYELGTRWSSVLSHVYEDIRAELNRAGMQGGSREEKLAFLRRTMKANADSTKDRKDFVKGIYCAWLYEKSDRELEEMFGII